ncbi:MAG TPA: PDZ domain-containing protein, partial [Candidatus Elarobacter sp.]
TDLTRTRLTVGALTVPDLVTRLATQEKGGFASGALAGSIGSATLSNSIIEIDYPAGVVRIAPARRQVCSEWDHAGMWLSRDGDALLVDGVVANGPASQAGIADGDRIVAVDAVPVRELHLPALRARLASPQARTVAMTVRTAAGERTVRLTLAPLL